jgi:sugar/nucleoside kinase (ribokinase family)
MFTSQVCGHICVDLIPRLVGEPDLTPGALTGTGPLQVQLGGSVANTGGDLIALGAPVRLLAEVGDDTLGGTLRALLETRYGRQHEVAVTIGGTTSYSLVIQAPGRDRTFWHHVGVNAAVDGSRVDPSRADLLHLGYPQVLPAMLANSGAPLIDLMQRARQADVTTSIDFCVLDPHSPAADLDWSRLLTDLLPWVDVISPSSDDLTASTGRPVAPTPEGLLAAADELVGLGAAVAMVTGGEAGLVLRAAAAGRLRASRVLRPVAGRWAGFSGWLPPVPVPVTSTVGAGDAATAGLLFGLLAGLDPDRTMQLAVAAAARMVRGDGALVPYADGSHYLPAALADPSVIAAEVGPTPGDRR